MPLSNGLAFKITASALGVITAGIMSFMGNAMYQNDVKYMDNIKEVRVEATNGDAAIRRDVNHRLETIQMEQRVMIREQHSNYRAITDKIEKIYFEVKK